MNRNVISKTHLFRAKKHTSCFVLLSMLFYSMGAYAGTLSDNTASERLLSEYEKSKGESIISFSPANIKQFWIDHSVGIGKDSFEILLNNKETNRFESVPLRIKLINVSETHDCSIEVISDSLDCSFTVLDSKLKPLSQSKRENDFLQYGVFSSVIHLENTPDFTFNLVFDSNKNNPVSIKRIILSFSNNLNSNYLLSPGILKFSSNDFTGGEERGLSEDNSSFSVSGKRFGLISKKKIVLSEKPLVSSVKVKNIGDNPTTVFVGYQPFTKEHRIIQANNNPYKNLNKVLSVISSKANSNKIIVDSYPEWEKGCFLALNAKEDLSDYPNFSFIGGKILNVVKIDDNHSEILLEENLKDSLPIGATVRVQSKLGSTYLYVSTKLLNPGEEFVFSSTIGKDEQFLSYSPKAFCKGTYYVIPIILSYSTDSRLNNCISISDFSISY